MNIPFDKLDYSFRAKPLLVGGRAMEYYGLRKSGQDIDLIVPEKDIVGLIKKYPDRVKDLWGDLGVCPFEFEIWRTINYCDYDFYKVGAIDEGSVQVISLEKLLFMKALAMEKEKYLQDTKLIANAIIKEQGKLFEKIKSENAKLLQGIEGINYIDKTGPKE